MSALAATDLAVIRHLETETATSLYVLTGHNAVAGHPLPNGLLPVGTSTGMVLISPDEWREYRLMCATIRAAAECSFWPGQTPDLEAAA